MKSQFFFSALLSLLLVQISCGGDGTSTSTTTTTTTGETSSTVPGDIVLSSPTATTSSASTSLSAGLVRAATKLAGDPTGNDYVAKKEALQELITGEGDCAFTLDLTS